MDEINRDIYYLKIITHNPSKYRLINLETGEVYEGTVMVGDGWWRAISVIDFMKELSNLK